LVDEEVVRVQHDPIGGDEAAGGEIRQRRYQRMVFSDQVTSTGEIKNFSVPACDSRWEITWPGEPVNASARGHPPRLPG